jgi:hypothetical protein
MQTATMGAALLTDARCCDDPAVRAVQAWTSWRDMREETIYRVPDGYRLVIEFVSAIADTVADGLQRAWLITEVGGEQIRHSLAIEPKGWDSGSTTVSQSLRMYADPATAVEFYSWALPEGTSGRVTISGYLVHLK